MSVSRPRVLVLGISGMLGSMVYQYLNSLSTLQVSGTARTPTDVGECILHLDVEGVLNGKFIKELAAYDYIVNCIGVTKPFCHDSDQEGVLRATYVNAIFPRKLSDQLRNSTARIIHLTTDAVFSGASGNYDESAPHDAFDVYGKTKSLGETIAPNFLNIRCSVIGPEINTSLSLLSWFLSHPKGSTLKGFTNFFWNGVTTLQFAKLCEHIILQDAFVELAQTNHVHHFIPNEQLSKFDLLTCFNKIYGSEISIQPLEAPGSPLNRVLISQYNILERLFAKQGIDTALKEMKKFADR